MFQISAEKFSLLRTLSDKILNKEAGKVGQSCSSSPGLSLMEAEYVFVILFIILFFHHCVTLSRT